MCGLSLPTPVQNSKKAEPTALLLLIAVIHLLHSCNTDKTVDLPHSGQALLQPTVKKEKKKILNKRVCIKTLQSDVKLSYNTALKGLLSDKDFGRIPTSFNETTTAFTKRSSGRLPMIFF